MGGSWGVPKSYAKEMAKKDNELPPQLEWMSKLHKSHNELLNHVGADNVLNAKRKIDRERRKFEETKEQLEQVVGALEVDNWRNAIVRARSLLDKLEKAALPVWLRSISPYWVGKVTPSSYKRWLHFCREQFLVAIGELQRDAELGLEVNVEEQLEAMKQTYMTSLPGEFVEAVCEYISLEVEEDGEDCDESNAEDK
jgi:hypothetical protein